MITDDDPAMMLMATAATAHPRAAGTELDQIARPASRDGRPLDLSTKESGVLEALLKASPIPVSAEITGIR